MLILVSLIWCSSAEAYQYHQAQPLLPGLALLRQMMAMLMWHSRAPFTGLTDSTGKAQPSSRWSFEASEQLEDLEHQRQ